jgi:hypothetical protein
MPCGLPLLRRIEQRDPQALHLTLAFTERLQCISRFEIFDTGPHEFAVTIDEERYASYKVGVLGEGLANGVVFVGEMV